MNNVYLINKPPNLTSFDIVAKVRKHTQIKKTGHAGTLDPFATGLLIVCTGKFTRLVDFFHKYPKTYVSRFQLGISTDTDDITGNIIKENSISNISPNDIEILLKKHIGEHFQQPCAISAKKVNGKRLYDVNRNGEKVKAEPVKITIHNIKIINIELPFVDVEIACSTGTYIRGIARDLGQSLNVGGIVKTLERTSIGPYSLKNSISIEDEILIPLKHINILKDLDAITLLPDITKRLQRGNTVNFKDLVIENDLEQNGLIRLFSPFFKNLIAICEISSYDRKSYKIKAEKVFLNEI